MRRQESESHPNGKMEMSRPFQYYLKTLPVINPDITLPSGWKKYPMLPETTKINVKIMNFKNVDEIVLLI